MEKQELNIKYEGSDFEKGKIDIKDFAPSLLALGSILEEANKVINGDKAEFKTFISSDFENKCFKCKLSLEASNIIQSAKTFFGIKEILNIPELLELLGFITKEIAIGTATGVISSYLVYKCIEKGRKVKKHSVNLEEGTVHLELEDIKITETDHLELKDIKITETEKIKVTINLFKIIKASWEKISSIQENHKKHFHPNGDISYSTTNNKEDYNKIPKEVKDAFLIEDKNLKKKISKQDPIETNLKIRMPDYTGDIKWKFIFSGKTIQPDFSNEIKKQLQDIRKEVKYNSKLPVVLGISYEEDENNELIPETEKYIIIKITGDLIQELDDYEYNYIKT